jgi:hypothetical protein
MTDRDVLIEILETLKAAQRRWCAEEVDDAEEMWSDVPEMLDEIVPKMERVLNQPRSNETVELREALHEVLDDLDRRTNYDLRCEPRHKAWRELAGPR